jgi:sugar O-acyltransferase (sialic acid O-acetyltransferase NeuD family)
MIEDLIIIGAGGSAGDIVWMVEELNHVSPRWRLRGFLDDDPAKQDASVCGLPVLGPVAAAMDMPSARFVVGIAHYRRPLVRAEVVARLNLPRERFATLIHPSASISPRARVGVGSLIFHNVLVCHGASVGDHTYLSPYSLVSHDAVVEDNATMAPGASLCGGSRLGAGAYAGARCAIKDGITIGPGAVVGIGSIVIRDVAPHGIVAGNPARSVLGRGKRGSA